MARPGHSWDGGGGGWNSYNKAYSAQFEVSSLNCQLELCLMILAKHICLISFKHLSQLLSSFTLVSGCPGGNSWGDLTVPPPSKEGESPSNLVLLVLYLVLYYFGDLGGHVKF